MECHQVLTPVERGWGWATVACYYEADSGWRSPSALSPRFTSAWLLGRRGLLDKWGAVAPR